MATRQELIQRALLDKAGLDAELYTSDDILTAAGITPADVEAFKRKYQQDIEKLANGGQ